MRSPDPPKIACLIKNNPQGIYFANQIHRHRPVGLVLAQPAWIPPRRKTVFDHLKTRSVKTNLAAALRAVANRIESVDESSGRSAVPEQIYRSILGDSWQDLDPAIPVVPVTDINGDEAFSALSKFEPDLILDHGTDIVQPRIFEAAPLALNLHWGLSPYYRGGPCTQWALLNWDPYNIGVTIHRLARRIDGGDVLCQARVVPDAADEPLGIDMKLTKSGTDLVLRAICEIASGKTLRFHRQDFALGHLYKRGQYTPHHARALRELLAGGGIARLLASPAKRDRVPVVELAAD